MGEGGELHALGNRTHLTAWTSPCDGSTANDTTIMSFVNIVETPGGGTHVDGFMNAITKQIRKAVEDNARKLKVNMKDSAMKVERDDIQAGLVAVVTARVAEPQFQGQTKDVLGTAQVKPIVTRLTDKQFGEMITGSGGLLGGLGELGSTLMSVLGSIGPEGWLIGAAVVGGGLLIANWDKVSDFFSGFFDWLGNAFSHLWDWIS